MNTLNTTPKVKELTGTKKRQFWFSLHDQPICTNSYFDGGTRREFRVVNINTGASFTPDPGVYPWTTKNEYQLKSGEIMTVFGLSCGKPGTPHIYCLPEDNERVRRFLGVV